MPKQVGRFLIQERLGAGTFAAVYRAHDPQLGRDVALKVPHPSTLESSTRTRRFLTEARAAARMHHPSIVPIYESGCDNGLHYIASAFIHGRTLAQAVEEGGPMDARLAAEIIRQLAEALAYAHKMGIVHRDVKPSNVLLDVEGQAHLVDFGLAFIRDGDLQRTQDGAILGTAAYIAPELATGRKGDPQPASDQYSLGTILYELLCGEAPFDGLPPMVLYQAIHKEPVWPIERNPQVPKGLDQICRKAMAKKPQDRFAGCREMAEALSAWLNKGSASSLSMEAGGRKPTAKKWALLIALAALALIIAFVLGWIFFPRG
jgi:serine/threonine protein kinase